MADKSGPQVALCVTERDNDFGPSKGVPLCASGCCTCCCCCVWTATGVGCGLVTLAIGSAIGKRKHGKPASAIRKGFWTGVAAGVLLYELGGLVAALLSDNIEDLLFYWFLWFGAAILFPMGVGGLIGAYCGRTAIRRSEETFVQDGRVASVVPAWWAVLGMWGGGGIGVTIGTKWCELW